jgi:hypothetical protein
MSGTFPSNTLSANTSGARASLYDNSKGNENLMQILLQMQDDQKLLGQKIDAVAARKALSERKELLFQKRNTGIVAVDPIAVTDEVDKNIAQWVFQATVRRSPDVRRLRYAVCCVLNAICCMFLIDWTPPHCHPSTTASLHH